jgi:hypothetical protein
MKALAVSPSPLEEGVGGEVKFITIIVCNSKKNLT